MSIASKVARDKIDNSDHSSTRGVNATKNTTVTSRSLDILQYHRHRCGRFRPQCQEVFTLPIHIEHGVQIILSNGAYFEGLIAS